jgi:coenzyme F420-0:L-glutamate ligase/coenzyme F420-1:gamma-L-glutamate ligase
LAKIVQVLGLEQIGIPKKGDDVGQLILDCLRADDLELQDGDVIVISQKIVSKADGLEVDISSIKPSSNATALARKTGKDSRLMQLILKDSKRVLRADKQALIVRRKDGLVCLNAGVDKSNVQGRHVYARLPPNSDASASNIRAKLEKLSGRHLAVIIADTYSRPYRVGQVEFAIGISGMEPIADYRGSVQTSWVGG